MKKRESRKVRLPKPGHAGKGLPAWFHDHEGTHLVSVQANVGFAVDTQMLGVVFNKKIYGLLGPRPGAPHAAFQLFERYKPTDTFFEMGAVEVLLLSGQRVTATVDSIRRLWRLNAHEGRSLIRKIWHNPVELVTPSRFNPPNSFMIEGDSVRIVARDIPEFGMIGKIIKITRLETQEQFDAPAPPGVCRLSEKLFGEWDSWGQLSRIAIRLPGETFLEVDLDMNYHEKSPYIQMFYSQIHQTMLKQELEILRKKKA